MAHTLLLADHSATIQRLIELTFAGGDVSVVTVGDGDRALASLRSSPPDIVLADVGMPGVDGYEVARHIKRTPALSHIPVLLLTGAFEPLDEAKARDAGYDGVVAKPFEPQAVLERVMDLLSARSRHSSAASDPQPADAAPSEPAIAAPRPAAAVVLDDYFERLDRAITTRVTQPESGVPDHASPSAEQEKFRSDAPVRESGESASGVRPRVLAQAFAALLAAEQSGAEPESMPGWPVDATPPPQHASDERIIEETTRRVLARLSDTVIRQAVVDATSATAERLIREEIERIKSNIT